MTKQQSDYDVRGEEQSGHKKGTSKDSPAKGKGLAKGKSSRISGVKSARVERASSPQETTVSTLRMNPSLEQPDVLLSLRDAVANGRTVGFDEGDKTTNMELHHHPFTVGRFFNLVQATEINEYSFLEKFRDELLELEFGEKSNDLYHFYQTSDLIKTSIPNPERFPHLNQFKSILTTRVKSLVAEITGISLSDEVDLFCGRYEKGDHLLCHDDELEGRRVAFIYYLVPPNWLSVDGGALDLFSVDARGEPAEVVRSLLPVANSFAFFPVGASSFHQVAEVLAEDKLRLSLSGWFHGSPAERPPRHPQEKIPSLPWLPSTTTMTRPEISDWISPIFFEPSLAKSFKRKFVKTSELQVEEFVFEEKIVDLLEELRESSFSASWRFLGPANRRRYLSLNPSDATPLLKQLLDVFRSEEMFFLLSHLTGLKLHPEVEEEEDEVEMEDSDSEGSDQGDDDEVGDLSPKTRSPSTKDHSQNSDSADDEDLEDNEDDSEPTAKKIKTADNEISSSNTPPTCDLEIRQWRRGCYSLLGDLSSSTRETSVLDLTLFVGGDAAWDTERHGGATVYAAADDEEPLLTMKPRHNALVLVFRERDTERFTKYVNATAPGDFFEISFVFRELNGEKEGEEEESSDVNS